MISYVFKFRAKSSINNFIGSIVLVLFGFSVAVLSIDANASVIETKQIRIDIKPGKSINNIKPRSYRLIPVLIFAELGFNPAKDIKQRTLRFGRTGFEKSLVYCMSRKPKPKHYRHHHRRHHKNKNTKNTENTDLLCYFKSKKANFRQGDDDGILRGKTKRGKRFEGRDFVRVQPFEVNEFTADDIPDVGITLENTINAVCTPGVSHVVTVNWLANDTMQRTAVTITAILTDGTTKIIERRGKKGKAKIKFKVPEGEQMILIAEVFSTNGNSADSTMVALPPCVDVPRPDIGQGFVAPPTTPPEPPIGIPSSNVNETDMVHLGGTPQTSANPTRIVSAVGTGSVVQLTSWILDPALEPQPVANSEKIVGFNTKLHVLTPPITPKLVARPFISGVIRDGKLWLTTWAINNVGDFVKSDTHGYGEEVSVKEYAIAHKLIQVSGDAQAFQVVTPIITTDNRLRFITWLVNFNTGDINGVQDSGDVTGTPANDSTLSAIAIRDAQGLDYVVTYKNSNGDLSTQYWELFNPGLPFLRGGGSSGVSISGKKSCD